MPISSRKVEDLLIPVQAKVKNFQEKCYAELHNSLGVDVLITCTYRDADAQNALYAQGRTKPGPVVTWAKGGESLHQYRVAFDILPLRHGKSVWGTSGNGIDIDPSDDQKDDLELWQRIGAIGKTCGLEWAGDWSRNKREFPHFQYTGGLTLSDFQKGKTIKIT